MLFLRDKLLAVHRAMQHLSGGRLEVISLSVKRFVEMRGPESAATLAYYALFSLFPLVLILAAILGFLLENSEQAFIQTVMFFGNVLPVTFTLVRDNMQEFLDLRKQLGIIGLVGALWSATSFFTTLAHTVNRAWPSVRLRNVVQNRLIGLAMVGALFLLLLFSLLSSAYVNLLPSLFNVMGGNPIALFSPLFRMFLRIVPALFSFLMFIALYRWVPNCTVRWRAVLKGAAVTALAWESAKSIFGYFISSGITSFDFLYGSLGTVMALMFWIYLSSMITLFGAYLVATLDLRAESREIRKAGAGEVVGGMTERKCWIDKDLKVPTPHKDLSRVYEVE